MNEETTAPMKCDRCGRTVSTRITYDGWKFWICNECSSSYNPLETRIDALERELKELRQDLENHRTLGI